jgi:choline kinase
MQAVILAAGQGVRLRPMTEDCPKCLVKVQGKPMLEYQLEALVAAGVSDCVIVVGYLGAQVRHTYGDDFQGMRLRYVNNPVYDQTNNIYSLWLARGHVSDDVLLLESDLVFDPALLVDLLRTPGENVAVVDHFQPFMNGTVILANGDRARAMVLKRDQQPGFDLSVALKTVNIYKFSYATVSDLLMPALEEYVMQGQTDDYYEMVIANAVADGSMELDVLRMGSRVWAEIDTVEELADAERSGYWSGLRAQASVRVREAARR